MPLTKKTFAIEGLHCGSCAVSVGMILRTVKGVASARANFDTKRVDVEYDATLANIVGMNEALEGLGYRLKEN